MSAEADCGNLTSPPRESTDALLARLGREREQREKRARTEFFASGEEIPSLDLMPPCPICDGSLSYDAHFVCYGCNVAWDRYGENGEVQE